MPGVAQDYIVHDTVNMKHLIMAETVESTWAKNKRKFLKISEMVQGENLPTPYLKAYLTDILTTELNALLYS